MALTRQQIAWAKAHDWFAASCEGSENVLVVLDREVDCSTGELSEKLITWTGSFRELREWAGY